MSVLLERLVANDSRLQPLERSPGKHQARRAVVGAMRLILVILRATFLSAGTSFGVR
jgi:hypothetical protein